VSVGDVSIWEGNAGAVRTAQLAVTLSDAPKSAVTVDVTLLPGSAAAGEDIVDPGSAVQILTFQPGVTIVHVGVAVVADRVREGDETFTVRLANPSGGFVLGDADAVGIVHDDD
jgi:endoglucanase